MKKPHIVVVIVALAFVVVALLWLWRPAVEWAPVPSRQQMGETVAESQSPEGNTDEPLVLVQEEGSGNVAILLCSNRIQTNAYGSLMMTI